jgi:hypothetical protein
MSYPSNATVVTFVRFLLCAQVVPFKFAVTHQLTLLTFRLAAQALVVW